jgi:release factor glutamine methyltransferase
MNAGELRKSAAAKLRAAQVAEADLDARVLLAYVLGLDTAQLLAAPERPVDPAAQARFARALERRAQGEPVARILGAKEFWSRPFGVSRDVLVPRPETETLVEAALDAKRDGGAPLRLLDLGTGSGALLGALLLERPNARGIGVDRNSAALAVARANLEALGVGPRASFVCGEWAAALSGTFDLIIANPPYVRSGDVAILPTEVREHDPLLALDGGTDGLAAYRDIVPALARLLAPDGVAVLELGAGQEPQVAALARSAHLVVNEPARRDLSGMPRALVVRVGGPKISLGRSGEPH